MAKHRTHSIAFKRQVVQEYLAGEMLHGLAHRHDLSRNLIRIWVDKYEAGAFDEDAEATYTVQEYEARIAAPERLVGKQAQELEFLKGVQRQGRRPGSAPMSVITGPQASPTRRHRLNRSGNRQANSALHMVVVCRMRTDARTRAYVARRTQEGLSKREVMRCLKRYVAREIYRVLTVPPAT